MFIGELFAGLIVYLYQKKFVKKTLVKDTTPNKLVDKILKKAEKRIKVIDSKIKIIFILFLRFFRFYSILSFSKYSTIY